MPSVVGDARLCLDKRVHIHAEKFRDAFDLALLQPHISRRTAAVAATEANKTIIIIIGAHAVFFTGLGRVSAKSVLSKAMSAEMEKSTP